MKTKRLLLLLLQMPRAKLDSYLSSVSLSLSVMLSFISLVLQKQKQILMISALS
jgi:hypothetical protein